LIIAVALVMETIIKLARNVDLKMQKWIDEPEEG